jgi:hypothetical protein
VKPTKKKEVNLYLLKDIATSDDGARPTGGLAESSRLPIPRTSEGALGDFLAQVRSRRLHSSNFHFHGIVRQASDVRLTDRRTPRADQSRRVDGQSPRPLVGFFAEQREDPDQSTPLTMMRASPASTPDSPEPKGASALGRSAGRRRSRSGSGGGQQRLCNSLPTTRGGPAAEQVARRPRHWPHSRGRAR